MTQLSPEVWHITGILDTAVQHAPGGEWSYLDHSKNITLCGRLAQGRGWRTGDDGEIPMEVTCKTCCKILDAKNK